MIQITFIFCIIAMRNAAPKRENCSKPAIMENVNPSGHLGIQLQPTTCLTAFEAGAALRFPLISVKFLVGEI